MKSFEYFFQEEKKVLSRSGQGIQISDSSLTLQWSFSWHKSICLSDKSPLFWVYVINICINIWSQFFDWFSLVPVSLIGDVERFDRRLPYGHPGGRSDPQAGREMDGWRRADGRGIAAVVVMRALDADPRGIQRVGPPSRSRPPDSHRREDPLLRRLSLSLFSRDSWRAVRLRAYRFRRFPQEHRDPPRIVLVGGHLPLVGDPSAPEDCDFFPPRSTFKEPRSRVTFESRRKSPQ